MKQSYFDTTDIKGPDLDRYESIAKGQDNIILDLFKKNPGAKSPSDILALYPDPKPLLTSVRRSINTLTKKNYLIKLGLKKKGLYKRPECLWALNSKPIQADIFEIMGLILKP